MSDSECSSDSDPTFQELVERRDMRRNSVGALGVVDGGAKQEVVVTGGYVGEGYSSVDPANDGLGRGDGGLGLGLGCCKRVKGGGKRLLGLGFRSGRRRRPVPGRGSGRPFGAQLGRHSDAAAPPRCRLSALVPVLVRLRSGDFSLQKC